MKKQPEPKKKGGKVEAPPPEPEPEPVEEEVEEVNPLDLVKTLREELKLKEVQGGGVGYFLFLFCRLLLHGRLPYQGVCYKVL